jgi:hypothetical protein
VAEPLLDFRDVGVVIQRVGRGGGAQRAGADRETQRERVAAHEFINAVRGDGVVEFAGAVVADGPEKGAFGVGGGSFFSWHSAHGTIHRSNLIEAWRPPLHGPRSQNLAAVCIGQFESCPSEICCRASD